MTTDMSGEGPRPAPRAANPAPSRTFRSLERPLELVDAPTSFTQDVDGTLLRWSVVEVDAQAVPGALGVRCLIFTRQDCIRRVWNYPANWRTLDDAGLAELSWHR